ncbi:helix-turn-helix domain-containing protein [Rodentibacter pneumotropicus]|uniref:Helix-turn-helix domain-containing protein n=1 Tax=Rodentibacter pneumotropicus TaxID=758 RepID=A0A1V3JZT5_9PAST|nr:helix-turn-helix transcriptional regulator [Rodentibacter pneumotropicus]MCQ9121361.1 helix-turn-helix domain-containing protein [Rodentibacter pneumotropicus]MDC2826452.1 helix-turn-helix transcriptional regulator [Rodentibacter pneumotropicus]NBH76340.1 XRE family transcriptional regulator [Rodentibacter pneumotropicus]OOF61599.1 transcriptional regulator [Rodentibacter pneumotropicus]OOF64866.1 DNA-binding protein [Rodentibacter pneumotropicus]
MKVNEKIKLLREDRQWTQEEMAQKLSMTTKGYAKIERGETISNLPRIEQIAEVFDMDICELLAYGEEGKIYINNTDNNLTNSFISLGNSSDEVQRLQQIIFHKDELLAHKEDIIESQKRELALLNQLIESLKK